MNPATTGSPASTASFALFGSGFRARQFLGHFPAHLVLDDLGEGDVARAQAGHIIEQRTAAVAAAAVQLADAPRDQVDQYIGVAHFQQGESAQFSVHSFFIFRRRSFGLKDCNRARKNSGSNGERNRKRGRGDEVLE